MIPYIHVYVWPAWLLCPLPSAPAGARATENKSDSSALALSFLAPIGCCGGDSLCRPDPHSVITHTFWFTVTSVG